MSKAEYELLLELEKACRAERKNSFHGETGDRFWVMDVLKKLDDLRGRKS